MRVTILWFIPDASRHAMPCHIYALASLHETRCPIYPLQTLVYHFSGRCIGRFAVMQRQALNKAVRSLACTFHQPNANCLCMSLSYVMATIPCCIAEQDSVKNPVPKKHHVLCRDALLLKVCLHCCAGQPSVCRGLCGVHVLPCTGHHLQGENLCSIQAAPRRPVFGSVCGQFLWLSLPGVLHLPAAASDVKPQRHLFATAAELPAPRQVAACHL